MARRVAAFFILFTFWLLLSGHFDLLHLTLGVICALLVTGISHQLLIGEAGLSTGFGQVFRFFRYLPWLLYQIAVANIDVAYRVLHPKMPIDPVIVTFKGNLRTDFGKVLFANSITLTPGTVTIDIEQNEFTVHAITASAVEALPKMQAEVRRVEASSP